MFLKAIFIQLLLFSVQSSRARINSSEIIVQPVKPVINIWITESMHNYEERPPDLVFLEQNHIPGLNKEMSKNIDLHKDITIESQIIKPIHQTSPYFGMLPLFMDVTDIQYEIVGHRNTAFLPDDGNFRLACITHGRNHFNTIWVDGNGKQLSSDRKIQRDGATTYVTEVLTVNAEIPSKSLGCQFSSPYFESSFTKWFNFTLIERPDAKLNADVSTCGQVTFTCLNGNSKPEEVAWIFNGVYHSIGSNHVTLRSNETVLKSVECLVKTEHASSLAHLDFNNSQILDCSIEADQDQIGEDGGVKAVTKEPPISDGLSEDEASADSLTIGLAIVAVIIAVTLLTTITYKSRRVLKKMSFTYVVKSPSNLRQQV